MMARKLSTTVAMINRILNGNRVRRYKLMGDDVVGIAAVVVKFKVELRLFDMADCLVARNEICGCQVLRRDENKCDYKPIIKKSIFVGCIFGPFTVFLNGLVHFKVMLSTL